MIYRYRIYSSKEYERVPLPNLFLQNYLRRQEHSKTNYNLIHETLSFLDCICGSTAGGLGLLGLYINESNVDLINQCLATLTEYCQGPCQENQVSHIQVVIDSMSTCRLSADIFRKQLPYMSQTELILLLH